MPAAPVVSSFVPVTTVPTDPDLDYVDFGTGEVAYDGAYEHSLAEMIDIMKRVVSLTAAMVHVPQAMRAAAAFTAHVMSFDGPMQLHCTGCVHKTCVQNLYHLVDTVKSLLVRRHVSLIQLYKAVRMALIYTFPFLPTAEREMGEHLYWELHASVPASFRCSFWFDFEDHEHVSLRSLGYVGSN